VPILLSAPVSTSLPSSAGRGEPESRQGLVEQELAGGYRTPADGSNQSGVGLGVELRGEERSELELLRSTVAQLRSQLEHAHDSLRICRQRQHEACQALRRLDEARPWRRRRVRRALRARQLL
jgi:hypothetical protein